MARSFNGNIPKVPIDADDSAARKKIDGIIKEIKNVPDIKLDADVSQAKRRIEQAASKGKINTQFLGDFQKVLGAIKSASSQNLPEDMYGNLIDSAEKFYNTFKSASTVIDGTTFSGLSAILNQVDDLGKISDISFDKAVEDAKALEQSTEQIAKNEERRKEAQKQLNKIKDAIRYREKDSEKISADLDSTESIGATIQKLSKNAEKVKELKTGLQELSGVDDVGFQDSLKQIEARLDSVFGGIEAKIRSLREYQDSLTSQSVDANVIKAQTEAFNENTQAVEKNAEAHEKAAKAKSLVEKPELLQSVEILEDREEIYDAKTIAQKRKVAEEMLRDQWQFYQEMKKEYEDPENATSLYGTEYESLLQQQQRLEAYVALYEKYGGKVEKIGKKFKAFSDDNGFAGSYQYTLDNYNAQVSAAENQIEANEKIISSYEGLCKKLNEYIELKKKVVSLHDSGEDISQYVPQLREIETDLTRGISDSLDLSSATMMIQSFPASIDERAMTNSLAQYLGIEVPQAAEEGKRSLKEFMSLFNELSAKSGDKNAFGQRYAYLLEGVSGENPTMDISAAYDELIQKEEEYQRNQEEQSRITAERAAQTQEFIRMVNESSPDVLQSENAQLYAEYLNKVSQEGLSAANAIEQLKSAMGGVKEESLSSEADSSTTGQVDNAQKIISSYEELCDVVKRYNLLLFESARSGGFTEEEEKEFSSIADLIQRSAKVQSGQSPFNYDGSIKSVEQLAQYLGIEIPAAAEKATSAMEEFSDSTKEDTNTQAVDELRARLATLGDEFKNSEQCTAIFDGLVESVKSGTKTAAQAIKELDAAFEQWSIDEIFKKPEQSAENIVESFKLSAKEISAALDSVDLRGLFKSLNIEDSDIPKLTDMFTELVRLGRAIDDGFDVPSASTQFDNMCNALMRLGSVVEEVDNSYEEFARHMRGVKIRYTDDYKAEFSDDWANIRKRFQSNLTSASSGEGIPADTLYQELVSSFPHIFSDEIINEKDQFKEILNALGKARDAKKNRNKLYSSLPDSYLNDIAEQISDYWTKAIEASRASKDSSDSIKSEAAAMGEVAVKAGSAAKAKGKFTNANKQAGSSAEESADSIKKEADAADDVNQAMSEPPDISGWDKVIDRFSDDKRTDLISRTLSKKSINEDTLLSQTTVQKWAKDQDGQWQMASETVTASIEGLITKYNNEMKKFNSIQTDIFDMDQSKFTVDFQNQINDYVDALNKFEKARNALRNSRNDPNAMPAAVEGFNQAAQNVRNLGSEIEKTINNIKKFDSYGDVFQKISHIDPSDNIAKIRDKMESLAKEVTNGTFQVESFDAANKVLTGTFTNEAGEIEKFIVALNGANNEIKAFHKNTGKKSKTFFGDLTKSLSNGAVQLAAMYLGINDIVRYAGKAVQSVRDIDLAMTELKKVTDETDESYANFLKTASKTASAIGATLKEFTNATSDFARLGYSMEEAADLAKVALVYENVGDGFNSVDEASESIISTMKAFGIEATDTISIVDKFNEVGNNFAITSKGIGDALQRSASSLYEAGNTLDESIGLITGMNSVVQDPEQVGEINCPAA